MSSFGEFSLRTPSGQADDGDYHFTATRKDGYVVTVQFKDHLQNESVTPGQGDAPAITDHSWIRAVLYDKNDAKVGYTIAAIPTDSSSNTIILDSFKLDAGGEISYSNAKANDYYVSSIRLGHGTDQNAPNSYAQWDEKIAQKSLTEGDFDGYTFVSNRRDNYVDPDHTGDPKTAVSNTITIRRSDPTEYHIKIDCRDNPLTIPEGVDIYAMVKIEYATGIGYGLGKVGTSTDGGKTYDVLVEKWYMEVNGGFREEENEQISGHERNMTAKLYAMPAGTVISNPVSLGSAIPVGGTVQTHQVEKYPSIPADYDPKTETGDPKRLIDDDPGNKKNNYRYHLSRKKR